MKQHSRLVRREQESHGLAKNQSTQGEALEFNSAEEAVRRDRDETEVPPAVAERIRETIAREAPPARRWWQSFFKR